MNYGSDNDNQNNEKQSLIISAFSLLSAKIAEVTGRSAVCRMLYAPDSVDSALGNGFFAGMVNKTDIYGRALRPAKSFFSRLAENSVIIRTIRTTTDKLLRKPLQTFGIFLFFLGLLGGGVTVLGKLGFISAASGADDLMLCALMAIFALPLMLSRRKLASVFSNSSFFKTVFVDRLGFETQKLKRDERGASDIFLVFLIAVIISAVSVFVPMTRIVLFLISACTMLFLICNPEAGVLACVAAIPIVGTEIIGRVLIITTVGYLLKVLVGKRGIKLSSTDIFVIMYFIYRLALVSPDGSGNGHVFAITCYFLARNLIRSNSLHLKYLSCVSLGVTVSSAIRLVYYLLSLPVFGSRFTAVLNIPGAMFLTGEFGIYLVAAFPITLACMLGGKSRRDRLYGFVSFALSLACIVFVFDSCLWVYAAMFAAVFAFISSKAGRTRSATAVISAFALPLIYTVGEALGKSRLPTGNIAVDILKESGIAGIAAFALIYFLSLLGLPSAVRMSQSGNMKYCICGCGTAVLMMPVAALTFSPGGMTCTAMMFWMTLGCFVSCEKMLERMTVNDEKQ